MGSTKERILSLLDGEISQLLHSYEQQIDRLNKEIVKLTHKAILLEKENSSLRSHISTTESNIKLQSNFYDLLSQYIERLSGGITHDIIDDWILSSSSHDAILLLTVCEKLYIDKNFEMLNYILDLLCHNQQLIHQQDEEIKNRFFTLVKLIVLEEEAEADEQYDRMIKSMYDILIELRSSNLHDATYNFLKENNEKMFDLVLLLNEPVIITKYLRLLFSYRFEDEVKSALTHILDVEWGFLDSSLTRDDFTFFLWYCFLFNLVGDLIDVGGHSLKWFDEQVKGISLYNYIMDDRQDGQAGLQDEIALFTQSVTLLDFEKESIINKAKAIKNQPEPLKFLNDVYSVDSTLIPYLTEKYKLKKRFCSLPLFNYRSDQMIERYVESVLYVSPDRRKAFIEKDKMNQLLKHNKPLVSKTKSYQEIEPGAGISTSSFAWPSTEIKDNKSEVESDEKVLNEKSDLKMMGYQISGLTRARRWEILEKAVPKLGLKKIAYTIAYNVKLRKGQKNGLNKFHHAITEWEHDLAKLKKLYYKKDFNWPTS
ncbi:hypothetical protein P2R12_04935 [Cytobacillus oceanisediminis]|uniref:hypothetical protein n=1 Tax=Cytobacillus oceanisediminis TaxID=665099 RepID=UPI0023DCE281|nr:hypothetical protein [Cytobacillus oceanisediminis]MDF2036337.1 hypothetical protein [Cytobacillus oceanisediminis]